MCFVDFSFEKHKCKQNRVKYIKSNKFKGELKLVSRVRLTSGDIFKKFSYLLKARFLDWMVHWIQIKFSILSA